MTTPVPTETQKLEALMATSSIGTPIPGVTAATAEQLQEEIDARNLMVARYKAHIEVLKADEVKKLDEQFETDTEAINKEIEQLQARLDIVRTHTQPTKPANTPKTGARKLNLGGIGKKITG